MTVNLDKKTLIKKEDEKISFCFKFCNFKKESDYSDKSKVSKFFRRMVIISNELFLNKDNYFILNKLPDLINNANKILKGRTIFSNIYDMFKGNNAFRVYGFFEKNIFYILELDFNHSSRPG